MITIKLVLAAPDRVLCDALREGFRGLPGAETFQGYFEDVPRFDCMVSPANSFGMMDGGVDAAIIKFFGADLMARVQNRILEEYLGEQPIGTSMIVETNHPRHPYIAHTPTMRIPMEIDRTDAVYIAMWSMLLAVRRHNQQARRKIAIVVCPGLGTGTGEVPFQEAARQMSLAYRHFLNPPRALRWDYVMERHARICGSRLSL